MVPGDDIHVGEATPSGEESGPPPDLPKTQAEFFTRAWEKVRSKFPTGPGVYPPQAFQASFAIVLACIVVAWIWCVANLVVNKGKSQ